MSQSARDSSEIFLQLVRRLYSRVVYAEKKAIKEIPFVQKILLRLRNRKTKSYNERVK